MIYANDFDTPKYQRPHDLPGATTYSPSSTMNSASPSTIALLPQELASGIFVSNDTSTLTLISQMSSTVSARAITSSSDTLLVCVGHGFDSAATGMIATVVVPTAVGLILWIMFVILRPRFRQIYALREWFVQPNLRPKPLGSSLFAFLSPNVPLVPPLPSDVSDAGRSNAQDAKLFPSDEELSQRVLFLALKIALGWSILALGGALPLYLVNIPCNADFHTPAVFGQGGYSTLSDLSLIRLLRLFDSGEVVSKNLIGRALLPNDPFHARIRVIVLTILTILLGLLPALIQIINEFNAIVAYRSRWLQVRCQRKDLGWLSARKAPGFATWGEKQFKDYFVKIGLSSTLNDAAKRHGNRNKARPRNGERRTRRREEEQPLNLNDDINAEVDIQSLFSIGDTHKLALLIDERDEILENLEIAETKYISSFRVTTPDPSVLDFVPTPPPGALSRPSISRPLPLGPQQRRTRGRRHMNRAFAASSLAPTSFVAPSSYYKLRGVQSINDGRFSSIGVDRHQSLTDSINSRVIGSRFLEVNRNSAAYGRLPLGSHLAVEKSGELGPVEGDWLPPIPDPRLFGPNYAPLYDEMSVNEHGVVTIPEEIDAEWVDLSANTPDASVNGLPSNHAGPSSFIHRPRVPNPDPPPEIRRETFPLRHDTYHDPETLPPPHLRLQPTQPFVRPLDGLGFDDLGHVYTDITQWRSRLKIINAEIAEAQSDSYEDIASGTNITGWLLVGRGLRFIPGVELIEGRAKEDIRWDVLQNERSLLDSMVMWAVIIAVIVAMAAALTAAVGLALAPAPDVTHYLPFLQPLLTANIIASGIATVFVPAVAATIFILLGLATIQWVAKIHGSVSISANQILVFKVTFFVLAAVGTLWISAIGALLFSMQAINMNTGVTRSLANGAMYMSTFTFALVLNVAIIIPACLVLQPFQLWAVLRAEKHAITPRQNFRAIYPRTYDPSFAIGACVLAILFASTFAFIFPLIAPAVVILLLLTLISHRFLVGYVYARTHSQTGGLLQIWFLRRFGTALSLQPILLGLIFLTRQLWILGGVLIATGLFVIVFMESYTSWKTRLPGRKFLSPITQNSLETFVNAAHRYPENDSGTINDSSVPGTRTRGSMASVLEMMSTTLAVMPSSSNFKGIVPLQTETLDDLTATERAARTHPDAPPHLPPLGFTDHAKDMAGILYAPELIAPPPIIWLPNDSAGVSRSEANDLQKYHNLPVTVDVRTKDDVLLHRRSLSS